MPVLIKLCITLVTLATFGRWRTTYPATTHGLGTISATAAAGSMAPASSKLVVSSTKAWSAVVFAAWVSLNLSRKRRREGMADYPLEPGMGP